VLDEFHERHLEIDLALALLRRLQKGGGRTVMESKSRIGGDAARYFTSVCGAPIAS
jgi:hypothetical protein